MGGGGGGWCGGRGVGVGLWRGVLLGRAGRRVEGELVGGRSRWPRLRLTRAWQRSDVMHDSPPPPFSRPGLFLSASENDHLKSCIARDLCHGVPPFAVGSMRMRVCRAPAASRSSGSRLYRRCDGGCAPPPLGFSAGGGICGKRVKPPVPATRCDAACADGAPFAKPVSDARPSCDQRRSSRAFCAQELLFKR